jgi:predicted phosphodiesterase
MTLPTPRPNPKIGMMADSHGGYRALTGALTFFREYGCDAICHLGDICDSAHPETADRCVTLLRENKVLGIKGNNDHQVAVNHQGRRSDLLTPVTIAYLENLPLVMELGDAVLTHSLPFVKERGLSSMVGVLGKSEAALFFRTFPNKTLFRGHSHDPEILRQQGHTLAADGIQPGKTIRLADIGPCIITCGALDQGFLMTWDPGGGTITCHMFHRT